MEEQRRLWRSKRLAKFCKWKQGIPCYGSCLLRSLFLINNFVMYVGLGSLNYINFCLKCSCFCKISRNRLAAGCCLPGDACSKSIFWVFFQINRLAAGCCLLGEANWFFILAVFLSFLWC